MNESGFVTAGKDEPDIPGCGNGWLQTGVAYALGVYDDSKVDTMFLRCRLGACPLIWRSPYKKKLGDETKADDYWGALIMSPFWAGEILDYAEKNSWNFDIFGLKRIEYRFDRFPHFAPFVRLCAGRRTALWDQAVLIVFVIFSSFRLETADGNMRAICIISVVRQELMLGKFVARLWESRARKRYGTIGKSIAAYFGESHPICQCD